MEAKIDNAIASGIPFVMGEVANLQDDQVLCQYTLNYSPLLHILQARNIGWLAWSWDNDGCADRQITTNGSFSSLTAYGNDILYNIDYGIYNFAPARSAYLFNGGFCNPVIARDEAQAAATLKLVPNPSNGKFDILFNHSFLLAKVEVFNAAGQLVHLSSEAQATRIHLDFEGPAGIYNVKISTDAGDVRVLKLVKI